MGLLIIVCLSSGVVTGLYVALLVLARGKPAGLLCVEQRTIIDHHHLVEHRVHLTEQQQEPVRGPDVQREPSALTYATPPAALTVLSRPARELPPLHHH